MPISYTTKFGLLIVDFVVNNNRSSSQSTKSLHTSDCTQGHNYINMKVSTIVTLILSTDISYIKTHISYIKIIFLRSVVTHNKPKYFENPPHFFHFTNVSHSFKCVSISGGRPIPMDDT